MNIYIRQRFPRSYAIDDSQYQAVWGIIDYGKLFFAGRHLISANHCCYLGVAALTEWARAVH